MAPSGKHAVKDRRKASAITAAITSASPVTGSLIVTLKAPSQRLQAILDPNFAKEESPAKDTKASPATSTTLAAAANSNGENASDSTPNTPAVGTPAPQPAAMGPPADGPKKKGQKRSAGAVANGNGEPKPRGKPGPKKKPRLYVFLSPIYRHEARC